MSDLEQFIHNNQVQVPHLIKIGLIHYQFETIHPFLDGNGRLGRLLIPLYLVSFGLLSRPALYLSEFFERHKAEYYDRLTAVRTTDNLSDWLRFFLIGIEESAEKSVQTFKSILALKESIEQTMLPKIQARKQDNARLLLQALYKKPVITINQVSELLDIQHNTATALVMDFVKMDLLKETTGHKRNRLYIFDPYIRIFAA